MLKKTYHTAIFTSLLLCIASCDEGRIYNTDTITAEEGGSAHLKAQVTGLDSWNEGYTLALAGFGEGNDYALISKNIEPSTIDGECDITLSGITGEVTKIELCAIDRLRRRVATFLSTDYSLQSATLNIEAGAIDLSMATAIQNEIFNTTCTQCHGGSGHAAANLNLLEGKSFANLVGVTSIKHPEMNRVEPGESSASILFMALATDMSASWNYDHSVEVVHQEKLDLIRNWIEGGAEF